jgi:hypothetical protein
MIKNEAKISGVIPAFAGMTILLSYGKGKKPPVVKDYEKKLVER